MVLDLPDELLEQIFGNLGFIDIVKCMRLCRRSLSIIHQSPVLQYAIELGVAGYLDNPMHAATPAQRYEQLVFKQDGWKDLILLETTATVQSLPVAPQERWETCRGIFVRARPYDSHLDSHQQPPEDGAEEVENRYHVLEIVDVLALATPQCEVNDTATTTTGSELPVIRTMEVAVPFADFTFDPGQNLLVLVVWTSNTQLMIAFKQLTTGLPHGKAIKPDLRLETIDSPFRVVRLQILGELVSVRHGAASSEAGIGSVAVISWRKGEIVLKKYLSMQSEFYSFTLISSKRYVVISRRARKHGRASLGQYDIQIWILCKDEPEPNYIAAYELPEFTPCLRLNITSARVSNVSTSTDYGIPYDAPYMPPPHPELLAFDIMRSSNARTDINHELITFFVPRASFFPTLAQLQVGLGKPPSIPWGEWGPASTRWFYGQPHFGRLYLHRIVSDRAILDFNLLDLERDISRGDASDIVCHPTIMPGHLFVGEVSSALPYRMSRFTDEDHSVLSPLLDIFGEENLVVFKVLAARCLVLNHISLHTVIQGQQDRMKLKGAALHVLAI